MDNQSNVNANEIVNQLYAWVEKQCSKVSDKNSCYFRSVHEQIDVLRFKYLIDLNQWYNEQFVPTMRCYQSNNSKSRSKAETYRIMAEMYTHSEMESMYEKGFELINKALRYAPFSSKNVISSCFNIRSELHQKLGEENLRSASKDIWNALHFRPKSFSSIEQQVHLLEKLNQRSDAYRLVRDSCLFEPSSFTANKMARLMEMKDVLAQYEFEPSKEVETVTKDLTVQEVKIDSRVDIVRNSDNQRLSFRANENIKPSTELIVEQPSMIILKRNGLKSYCNRCNVQCERTFFPCYGCIDIVFCSKECSELDTNHHQFECGVICLIHNHIATKAHHVYRLLTTMEPSNLVSMDKLFKGYSPESYWNQIRKDKIVKVKTEQMQNWFQIAQNDLRRQVERRQPLRSASELTVAILVLCLYRYQLNLDSFGVKNDDELSYLIAILATEMAKVTLTEFGWHDYVGNDRRSLASFQCLIASNINHSCEYNSTWDYSNGRLIIRSERSITNGESITITYGSLQSKPLYKRLNHVQCFSVMCYCNKCRRDVKKQFAFRCDNCSFEKNNSNSEHCGPVPYDPNEFTELVCMRCELRWTYAPKAQDIMGEFLSTRKMVWLLNGIDNTQMTNERANNKLNDDNGGDQLILLDDVCKQMDRLAGYIYPHQEQWLTMVSDLCLLLIEHSMYSKAVDWFQWFVDRFNIYLFNVKSDDSLKKYFLLDQWTTAYLGYLIHTNSVNVDCDSLNEFEMKYIRTSEKLFEQTFAVIDKILTRTDLDRLFLPSIKTYSMVRSLHESSIAKLKQFKDITQSRFEIPPPLAEIVPDDELEDELEFIETADDPVEERPTNLIDLSNVEKPELVVTKPSNPLVQQTQQQFGEELIEQNSFSSGDGSCLMIKVANSTINQTQNLNEYRVRVHSGQTNELLRLDLRCTSATNPFELSRFQSKYVLGDLMVIAQGRTTNDMLKIEIYEKKSIDPLAWTNFTTENGSLPTNVTLVIGGIDNHEPETNEPIFICRFHQYGTYFYGYTNRNDSICRSPLSNSYHESSYYQLLDNPQELTLNWVSVYEDEIPNNAIYEDDGQLFIGRVRLQPNAPTTHSIGEIFPFDVRYLQHLKWLEPIPDSLEILVLE